MKQAAEVVIRGLKCDAAGCDYLDETAVPDEALIGKLCPKCGANLLTAEDMAYVRFLQGAAGLVNSAHGMIPDDSAMTLTPVIMDGTGKLEFGETKIEEKL